MTHDRGFHMNERNWRKALGGARGEGRSAAGSGGYATRPPWIGGGTYFSLVSGSLLGPKTSSRRAASSSVRPFSSHLKIGGAQDKSKDGAALGQSSGSGEEGLEGHALEKLENLLHDDVLDVDLVLVVKVLNSEVDLRPGRPRERGQSSRPEKIVGSRKREERTVSRATRACWSPSDSDRRGKERRGRSSAGL